MATLQCSPKIKLYKKESNQFTAFMARHNNYGGLMNPVIGFDYFKLSEDVFGPHQHVGMSALSYIFEDSIPFRNRDSMGTDLIISSGSLLWTWAGSGVVHHETPAKNEGQVHGLQLFLDIPHSRKNMPPQSVYIPVEKMPVLNGDGISVKVVAGTTGNALNPVETPEPVTILDVNLKSLKYFEHKLPKGWNATIYVLSGKITIGVLDTFSTLDENDTQAFGLGDQDELLLFSATVDCRFLLISGPPVN